jgi:hypothetical protein
MATLMSILVVFLIIFSVLAAAFLGSAWFFMYRAEKRFACLECPDCHLPFGEQSTSYCTAACDAPSGRVLRCFHCRRLFLFSGRGHLLQKDMPEMVPQNGSTESSEAASLCQEKTMPTPWLILTKRYGGDIRQPTDAQLGDAVDELYVEALPGMTENDYREHGGAFLRRGFDDGPMFVITISRHGQVSFEEWEDQDFEKELCPARTMSSVPRELALNLMKWLVEGRIDLIRNQPWEMA